MSEPLAGISTNIITGFLGAGKSTTILDLISNKPRQENWAILVNEFGEVGIDGGLLAARDSKEVFIILILALDPLFWRSFGRSRPLDTSFDKVGYDYFISSVSKF